MVKTALNDIYLWETTPTALKNEIATCWQMYYDKENHYVDKGLTGYDAEELKDHHKLWMELI